MLFIGIGIAVSVIRWGRNDKVLSVLATDCSKSFLLEELAKATYMSEYCVAKTLRRLFFKGKISAGVFECKDSIFLQDALSRVQKLGHEPATAVLFKYKMRT